MDSTAADAMCASSVFCFGLMYAYTHFRRLLQSQQVGGLLPAWYRAQPIANLPDDQTNRGVCLVHTCMVLLCICPADINACTNSPCKLNGPRGNATCQDIAGGPNSPAGRRCNCTTANAFYANDTTGCVGAQLNQSDARS